ncbi:hypothetical protein ACWGE0_02020 [Lentzea sp. NPDC054927]
MRGRSFGVLLAGLVLASTVTAPQAVAADPCRWIAHDLPLPTGATYAKTTGSSENNRFIVGSARIDGVGRGLVWNDGTLIQMASPDSSTISIEPKDVSDGGLVVGRMERRSESRHVAFRYFGGTYEVLDTPGAYNSQAIGVNQLGDVVGEMWSNDAPDVRSIVVWVGGEYLHGFTRGQAIGISNRPEAVMVSEYSESAFVINVSNTSMMELPGARTPMVFDNERVLHYSPAGIKEWTTAGEHVATWAGGTEPFGRTSSGHVVFGAVMGTPTLWQWGIRYPVDSAKLPNVKYYGDISDEGALIATYEDLDGSTHPARWFWCG